VAKKFPFYKQLDTMDCGPTCLRMICSYYGKNYNLQYLRDITYQDREGVSLHAISEAAENLGLRTLAVKVDYMTLVDEVPLPCIAHWKHNHFVVVYKATKSHVWVADPGKEKLKYTRAEFEKGWLATVQDGTGEGILLALETSPEFFDLPEPPKEKKLGAKFIWAYLRPYRPMLFQVILGLFLGSFLMLIFPFLTQAIVDIGIGTRDLSFIYLILLAQLVLFVSSTAIAAVRSWLLLHIGARMNIALLSDFLIKLTRMPIRFFESKMIGDLLQRMSDHYRIELFLTSNGLRTMFSMLNLIVFGIVLLIYSQLIFGVFFAGSLIYIAWSLFFIKKRRIIDYKKFEAHAANQNALLEILNGMQEIKLQNSERRKRWNWERVQAKLFKTNVEGLAIEQYQTIGASFVNELKNIIISFLAAKSVIDGDLTLGMMLSVQYIIGQLNVPLLEFIQFLQSAQDASISLERMGEIHNKNDEIQAAEQQTAYIPEHGDFEFKNVWFRYGDSSAPWALKDISLKIPRGKVTAIVGSSGSGKTTLVKLLLRFYETNQGDISIGKTSISGIANRFWRSRCGAVMQDGFIFSDTIANNIGVSEDMVDRAKLLKAVHIANIQDFIEDLPLGYNTKVGASGIGLSQGQKQRLLIARAVYKNPEFLFFDEATNALDAENEKVIVENLNEFSQGKTVIVVAHRLSTVKDADQIIVMEKGELVEIGNHQTLTEKRGRYYQLIKNQLELGA
jgi:ATP-binding cassette, subfamily B, bacterial